MMRPFLIFLAFALALLPGAVSAETEEAPLTVKGNVSKLNLKENTLRLENEKGFEMTFHWDAATQVLDGMETKSADELRRDDPLEIEYRYNENYERVAQIIRKLPAPETDE